MLSPTKSRARGSVLALSLGLVLHAAHARAQTAVIGETAEAIPPPPSAPPAPPAPPAAPSQTQLVPIDVQQRTRTEVHFLAYQGDIHYTVEAQRQRCTTPCTLALRSGP